MLVILESLFVLYYQERSGTGTCHSRYALRVVCDSGSESFILESSSKDSLPVASTRDYDYSAKERYALVLDGV